MSVCGCPGRVVSFNLLHSERRGDGEIEWRDLKKETERRERNDMQRRRKGWRSLVDKRTTEKRRRLSSRSMEKEKEMGERDDEKKRRQMEGLRGKIKKKEGDESDPHLIDNLSLCFCLSISFLC